MAKETQRTTAVMELSGLTVQVTRKRIKNLYLRVSPPNGRVCVSAPLRQSDAQIAAFVRSRLDWVRRQREKIAARPQGDTRRYVTGETLYLWGRPCSLQVEETGRYSLHCTDGTARLTVRRGSTPEQRRKFVLEWYRAQLKEAVENLLPDWEERTGLFCSGWQSKNMTTRWGTCNTRTRKIWLNLQLAALPSECLSYIILHELAHLKVPNHGPDFTALLDAHLPCWRDARALLQPGTFV